MGDHTHKFILIQDGAAAIIVDPRGKILLQSHADRNKWRLPGGCQEVGESFEEVIICEIKGETNLDIEKEDLRFICVVSGKTRKNSYPNGDTVFSNTMLYYVEKYSGNLKWNEESKDMKIFSLDRLPNNQNDLDLIISYKEWKKTENNNSKKCPILDYKG